MKANEFVKKFGWEESKKHLLEVREAVNQTPYKHSAEDFSNDLKRLIESHDLVLLFDDLDCAKAWINDLCEDWPYQVKGSDNKFFKWQLEQAITDVESCMEGV